MTIRRLRYLFPLNEDFREQRPVLCWEHMYGWIDGYGVLFDPVVMQATGLLPEWENGWDGNVREGDYLVTSCSQATDLIHDHDTCGLFIRPRHGVDLLSRNLRSDKERLVTPVGCYYYPQGRDEGLAFDRYAQGVDGWQLAEHPAVASRNDGRVAVAFELFSMLWAWNADWPERRLTVVADMVAALISVSGCFPSAPALPEAVSDSLRLDFQAYGINRLLMQWLLERQGSDRNGVANADGCFLEAVDAWHSNRKADVLPALTAAFSALTDLRKAHSRLSVFFCDYPHMGILLEQKGFFELEWPEHTRRTLASYIEQNEQYGYRFSLEAGAGCWRNLSIRFPGLCADLRRLWEAGEIDLTNGTYSLPYALLSPLTFQYLQFLVGHQTFRRVFGRTPIVYQAQENSLSPQLPQLLRHFGYRYALHISQNHGTGPEEPVNFITWQSPSGCGIPAMTVRERALSRKGPNYFLDLPLIHGEYGREPQTLNYVNFQDLGYVPFRVHMIRAHRFAPVWGAFALSEDRFAAEFETTAPVRKYSADAYRISENIFYANSTNTNAISQYERVFTLAHRYRQIQFMAYASGSLKETQPQLTALLPQLLVQEAHDATIVQGQRRGEFHASCTQDPPPYSRETLGVEVAALAENVKANLDAVQASLSTDVPLNLYNASGVVMPYAHVRDPTGKFISKGLPFLDRSLVEGPFPPFSAARAAPVPQEWSPRRLPLRHGPWRAGVLAGKSVRLTHQGQSIHCFVVDKRHGPFIVTKTRIRTSGSFAWLEQTWEHPSRTPQLVQLDLLLHLSSSVAEIQVRYAPRCGWDERNRWDDYLALEVCAGSPLETVWRFNPNVRSVTSENRIASPGYLAVQPRNRPPFACLNEGAFLYAANREAGSLQWLFHVANETRWERRMAIAFGTNEAYEQSRAWSQGVVPLSAPRYTLPSLAGADWSTLSAETFTPEGRLLISNVQPDAIEITVPKGVVYRATEGNPRHPSENQDHRFTLQPFEIGFLEIESGCHSAHRPCAG